MSANPNATAGDFLIWFIQSFHRTLLYQEVDNHSTIFFDSHSNNTIKSFWTQLIVSLSHHGLVNGVLDVPITFVGDTGAVFWLLDHPVICTTSHTSASPDLRGIPRPVHRPTLSIAIGGPSGAGKTSLIRLLAQTPIGVRLTQCATYTTRPRRFNEIHGQDYYFVDIHDIALYRANSIYGNFVTARGHWYWTDLSTVFLSKWQDQNSIYITTITQRHEFLALRAVLSDLKWLWLDASESTIHKRLSARCDEYVGDSLTHNRSLSRQQIDDLITLRICNDRVTLDAVVQRVVDFILSQSE